VNDIAAIRNGGLAGNSKFFGSATAEIISTAVTNGSWNGDRSESMQSTAPWPALGGQAPNGTQAGSFAFARETGGVFDYMGHRTILSGY
jgi:hypothetical protein